MKQLSGEHNQHLFNHLNLKTDFKFFIIASLATNGRCLSALDERRKRGQGIFKVKTMHILEFVKLSPEILEFTKNTIGAPAILTASTINCRRRWHHLNQERSVQFNSSFIDTSQ